MEFHKLVRREKLFFANRRRHLNEFSKIDKLHDDGLDPHDVVEEDLPLELLHREEVPLLLRVQGPDGGTKLAPDL